MADVNTTLSAAKIDQIVATYAPIGAQKRRKQRVRRLCFAGGAVVLVGCGALLTTMDYPSVLGDNGSHVVETTLHEDALEQLARERAEFSAQMASLERQLEGIKAQKSDLDAQQATLVEQSERLTQLLDDIGAERAGLEKRERHGSQLDEEIAAIAAQRKALEKRWKQFDAQGELLAMEIIAVNAQRKELELQRRQIALQRQELAELLQRAATLPTDDTSAANEAVAQAAGLTAMDSGDLDQMRGGFSIGEGLDVSFGFTQTGSVNGIEQYRNNFTIGSMAKGLQNVDMSNMNSVVLQNGAGNFVSANVLDSLADSFGNIVQNTLDDQVISTTTTYDIALHNVPGIMQGMAGEQALLDSVGAFR